jgi:hypothetical protein
MKNTYIYFIRGQGGSITSPGIDHMAASIGIGTVTTYNWGDWEKVREDIAKHEKEDCFRLACGYSLGANALTWILGGVHLTSTFGYSPISCQFDAAVFLDPTWMSVITPLQGSTLKRAVHYRNYSLDIFGHGTLTLASDFDPKNLTIMPTYTSHFLVDTDVNIQLEIFNLFHSIIGA